MNSREEAKGFVVVLIHWFSFSFVDDLSSTEGLLAGRAIAGSCCQSHRHTLQPIM